MMNNNQKKALELCHSCEYGKAWAYWKLMGNDYGIFLGEVPASEFITGDDLANSIGLTAGNSQYSDTPWLKFLLNNELIYIPKKPIRNDVSWEDIYQVGAVYGTNDNGSNPSGGNRLQDASVTIGGYDFKVTLLRGADSDPTPNTTGFDLDWTHNSEWNKLMYPIHSGVHTSSSNPSDPSVPYNQWASYSDDDLITDYGNGNGSLSWTQETHGSDDHYRLLRGSFGVTYVNRRTSTRSVSYNGWRGALRSTL